ncbi:MAG: lytic transglycosylase domain-containing protein [Acetobacteraceae bacterium]|nr:lytic transglycosylase domain-containing protein [Acetobacteraceae bacterium]
MSALTLAAFAALAAACAPSVHVDTLAAVARAESGLHPFAIGDNTGRRSFRPASAAEAAALARALLREGRSLDLGLMQVNSANLSRLGMTVDDAFDPCRSLAAAERVLRDGWRAPPPGEDAQAALLRALSHYNTGHPERGFRNGYVARVQAAADAVVPALRLRGQAVPPAADGQAERGVPAPPPPDWDVYGQARWRRSGARPPAPPARDPPARLEASVGQAPP